MDIIGGLIYLENEITNKVTNEIIKQTLKSIRIGRSQKSAVNFRKFWGSLLFLPNLDDWYEKLADFWEDFVTFSGSGQGADLVYVT